MNVIALQDAARYDVATVGGKAHNLGIMLAYKLPVPLGFVIPAPLLSQTFGSLPSPVRKQILQQFDALNSDTVAVRSSAANEDSSNESWAGMFETYLNVSRHDVIERIHDCWRSTQAARPGAYKSGEQSIAVIVQQMIPSTVSGVLFTVNPVNGLENELVVEAVFGLGELLVQGSVTPDSYIVDKTTDKLISQELISSRCPALRPTQLSHLTELARQAEKIYGHPLDLEWAFARATLYLLQARPITTLGEKYAS